METNYSSNWNVDIITDLEGMNRIKGEWNILLHESQYDSINLTYEWISTVWKHYISFDRSAQLCVISIRTADKGLIAILPLMTVRIPFKKFFRIRQLCFVGQDFNDYCGFIIKNGMEEVVSKYFFSHILAGALLRWETAVFKNLSEKNPVYKYLAACVGESQWPFEIKESTKYYYINPAGPYPIFFQGLGRRFKQKLNALNKYLDENNRSITFVLKSDYDEIVLRSYLENYKDRLIETGRESIAYKKAFEAFLLDFCLTNKEAILLSALKIGDETIAFAVNLVYNGQISYWIPSFKSQYSQLAPGHFLIESILKHCFVNRLDFDFMRGDSDYKTKWTKNYYQGYLIRMYNSTKPLIRLMAKIKR